MFIDPTVPGSVKRTVFPAIVTPRPIGWISTLAPDGRANLAPFSFFNLASSTPPTVMFASNAAPDRDEKDTITNIRRSREFVYNLASVPLAPQMVKTSAPQPYGEDEFELAGLEKAACVKVQPPRVAASPVAFECVVYQLVELLPEKPGDTHSTIVIGRVVGMHVRDGLIGENGRFDTLAAQPLARLGGFQYGEIGRTFEIEQPFRKIV
ncbi:MAG TPA: flavin reductase family protein [Ramlibacter sp.]|nr:flavin reductase family protein [Ramlibacter sp.]